MKNQIIRKKTLLVLLLIAFAVLKIFTSRETLKPIFVTSKISTERSRI
jgi:hypothetical protein